MSDVKKQLSAAIRARKDSLIALRERIAELLADVPIGVKLSDEQGLVCKVVRVCTGASQWSNREWDVVIKGRGYLSADGRLVAEQIRDSYFDGSNIHRRSTEPTCLGGNGYEGGVLDWASGKATRAVAARLPDALARYMAECEAERAANEETLL